MKVYVVFQDLLGMSLIQNIFLEEAKAIEWAALMNLSSENKHTVEEWDVI